MKLSRFSKKSKKEKKMDKRGQEVKYICKEDLKKVQGIGDGKFKKLEDSITL